MRLLSEEAQEMKMRLEQYPSEESIKALESEIRLVRQRSFDQYLSVHAFPSRRFGSRVQTSGLADITARLAVGGRELFEQEKQRDLKHLVSVYREDKRFMRMALSLIAKLPEDEAALIMRHCIHGESITAVATQMGMSRATGYRRYDEAVAHFTDLYYSAKRGMSMSKRRSEAMAG